MKRFSPSLPLAALLFCTALAGCGGSSKKQEPIGEIPATSTLDNDTVRKLLIKGARAYAGVLEMATQEKSIVKGKPVVRLDPKRVPTMGALRSYLLAAFTDRAADSVLFDLGVVEDGGKLWLAPPEPGDIRSYDESEIVGVEAEGNGAIVDVEIPLGDSGQTDELRLLLAQAGGNWRVDSNPYGAAEEQ